MKMLPWGPTGRARPRGGDGRAGPPALVQLRHELGRVRLQELHPRPAAVRAEELRERRLLADPGAHDEELLGLEGEAGAARHADEEAPDPVGDAASEEQQRPLLQLRLQPLG